MVQRRPPEDHHKTMSNVTETQMLESEETDMQEATLKRIHDVLTKSSSTQTEFIPLLYHSLKQISKHPNNSSNSLDAATSSIRHRLKTAKVLLQQDPHAIELLSRTPEQWQLHLQQRKTELENRNKHIQRLREAVGQ